MLLLLLVSCGFHNSRNTVVSDGKADLSKLDVKEITTLDGLWEFYPDRWLIPGEEQKYNSQKILIHVPSAWTTNPQGQTYGSYRLELTGLTPGETYSFYFFEKISAAVYYVDHQMIGQDGIPGKSRSMEVPEFIPSINSFTAKSTDAVLLIQISNFSMKNGGFWESVYFGTEDTMYHFWTLRVIALSMIIGAMIIMGFYHLFIYLMNREDGAPVWLSICIGLIVLKTMITGENILMKFIPFISQVNMVKLATATVILMTPSYMMFLNRSFPGICSQKILQINLIVSVIYSFLVIVLVLPMIQTIIAPYLLFIVINQIYLLIQIILAVIEKRPGSQWSLLSSILLMLFILNDILYDMHIIQTAYLLNLGLLIFLLLQALLNADRNRLAYKELTVLRTRLETEVENRTEELKEERNKLEILARNDALTGLYNRNSSREIFEREILRFHRTKAPFTVVMIDLDYFKAINDSYGHAAGDYALRELGKAIRKISRRTDFCFRWGVKNSCS